MPRLTSLLFLTTLALLLPVAGVQAKVTIHSTNYHGWPDALIMGNGEVEVVIVPAIGRVMQFGFVGEEGVFWENRALDGKVVDATTDAWRKGEWVNLGGDKTWPAPEGEWSRFTQRQGWRPPPAFDGLPATARIEEREVVLTSAIDPFYGLRAQRRLKLHASKPVLTITTTYERLSGDPAKIGVWVITQLKSPIGVFAPVPVKSIFAQGHTLLGKDSPPDLKSEDGLLSLKRHRQAAYKIGLDAGTLVWVGARHALRIDAPRVAKAEYPDQGSSTEIYTNPDPLPYVELETLSPLHLLKAGDKIKSRNVYTLVHRRHLSPAAEARALMKE